MTSTFENILDQSLQAVLDEGEGIATVCARYPDVAAELKPLLELALSSRSALRSGNEAEEISATARAAGREKILARMREEKKSWWHRHGPHRGMLIRPVALGTGAVLALSTGTAMAASTAGPGSTLYPLEQKLEDLHTALTFGKVDKAGVEIDHANYRLDELESSVATDKSEHVPDVLTRYENNINKASNLVKEAAGEGDDTGDAESRISSTRDRLAAIVAENENRMPEDAKAAAREALKESDDDVTGLPASGGQSNDGSTSGSTGGQGTPAENDYREHEGEQHHSGDSDGDASESSGGSYGSGGDSHENDSQERDSGGDSQNSDSHGDSGSDSSNYNSGSSDSHGETAHSNGDSGPSVSKQQGGDSQH